MTRHIPCTLGSHGCDKFIAKGLTEKGLAPVDEASKAVLLRRLTYDLTGLPPSEEDLLAFTLDESEKATESLVDRLLASKAFGERWGRHWLDLARYGESTGSARNLPYPHAWRYRDYVIDSFNNDKPYNLFLQEQLAGDQLPASSLAQKREQLVATGFLALGVKDVNQRFKVRYDMDNVDEQIDTVSRAVIGLTVSCARAMTTSSIQYPLKTTTHSRESSPVPSYAMRCAIRWAAADWLTMCLPACCL